MNINLRIILEIYLDSRWIFKIKKNESCEFQIHFHTLMNTNLKQRKVNLFAFHLNLKICDELDPITSNC